MPAPKDPEKYKLWRERLKAAKVGFIPWNKGRKISDEPEFDAYRKNMSESGRKRKRTPRKKLTLEHRANLSKAKKGKRVGFANGHKHTEATRKKMSASQTGKKRGPLSEEQRLKISNTLKRTHAEHPELFVRGPVSEEQKAKQSESMRRFYATERGAVQKQKLGELAAVRQNGKPLTEAHRQAISKANKETFSDPEIRNDLSARSKAMWNDPDARQKLILALNTDEARTVKSEAAKQRWANPDYKDHMSQVASAKMTERWADPEARAKLEAANANVESRVKKSKATKEHWSDPEVGTKLLRAVLDVCSEHTKYKHGWYFSEKMQQEFYYRSSYELRAYQILDADPFVTFFFPEPLAIPYLAEDGQAHRYVPDLYVEYKSGYWQFLEVKPEARLKEADNELKHQAAMDQYAGHFQVWAEANLEQGS